jgi:osmotically-inducible protein OsmY
MKTFRTSLCLACCLLLSGIAASLTGCASGRYERTAGEYIDDNIVTTRVAKALAANPEYKFTDVVVASHQGTVQLSGFVASGDQKGRAEEITEKVQGVKGVENNITVRP